MKLLQRSLLICLLVLVCSTFHNEAIAASSAAPIEQQLEVEAPSFKDKINSLSAKQKEKLTKKMDKIQKKIAKKEGKGSREGIKTGLVIVGVGAVVAILGLAGIADILITIGLVVLVLGLLFWLLDLL